MILPRFFKNLGPISLKKIKTNISCETINLKASQEFLNLVGIDNQEDNTLTFIVDGDTNLKKIPKNRTIICSKKISKQLSESQKTIIVPNVHFAVAKLSNIFFREFNNEREFLFSCITLTKGRISKSSGTYNIRRGSLYTL